MPRTRVRFTEEDDQLLTRYVKERVRAGKKERGNIIYLELEEEVSHYCQISFVQHLTVISTHTTLSKHGATDGLGTCH